MDQSAVPRCVHDSRRNESKYERWVWIEGLQNRIHCQLCVDHRIPIKHSRSGLLCPRSCLIKSPRWIRQEAGWPATLNDMRPAIITPTLVPGFARQTPSAPDELCRTPSHLTHSAWKLQNPGPALSTLSGVELPSSRDQTHSKRQADVNCLTTKPWFQP